MAKGGDSETVFRSNDVSIRAPKGTRMKIVAVILSAVLGTGGATLGIKEYVEQQQHREAERAKEDAEKEAARKKFEDDRYAKLEAGLHGVVDAINEFRSEMKVGAFQKAESDRRFAAVEAELKVQSALWSAMGDKYVRREDFERAQRELQKALQDIAELKAKVK